MNATTLHSWKQNESKASQAVAAGSRLMLSGAALL
jgi:hypothetical protein